MRPVWLLPIAVGCAKAPVEAPKELGELGLFLFQHFEDEESAELEAGFRNLVDYLDGVDMTLDAKDRAVTMPVLQGADLGDLAIPDGADPEKQVPVAIAGVSEHPLDDQRVLMLDPVQTCIESSTTVWAGREFPTDPDCFERADCERLETTTAVRKDSFIAKVWYDQFKTYRELEVDDLHVIAGRAWTDRVFPGDGSANSWDQLFHLDVYIADGPRTLRWFSMWSSISVTGLGDDLFSQMVISGLEEALIYGDERIEGVQESCPHDRSAPQPTRE